MNKKATDQTNDDAQYFNQNKNQKFDLPALLASGKYFIDELGFLVGPNGTRYRIPSGPPEGRKPLRLDKPKQLSKVNLNYSTPPFNKSHRTAHIELQDTNKLTGLSRTFLNRENVSLYIPPFLSKDNEFIKAEYTSTRTTITNGSSLLNSINPNGFRSDILHSLDWNVILLTLIISSISLVLNTILIVFLSWRLSHHKKWRCRREKYSDIVSYSSEEGSQNVCRCEQPSCKCKGDKYTHFASNHIADFKCKYNPTEAGDYPCANDPIKSKPRRLSHFWYSNTNQSSEFQPQIYHNNGRHIKHVSLQKTDKVVMINQQHLHVPNNFAKTSWAFHHHHPHPHHHQHQHPHEPVFCKAHEHLDVSSMNDGSWQMVASDGVITDDTSEENRDGSLDSKTNSDILFSPSIKPKKRSKLLRNRNSKNKKTKKKKGKRKKLQRRCLDETLSESSMNNLHSSIHPPDTYANKQSKMSMLNKTSSINDHFPYSNPHTTHISSDYKLRILRDSLTKYNLNVYVCHTLGIHLGILGALLSLLQLTAICIALVSRSTLLNKTQELYHISTTSEFICLITSSLASDAILCARLYLLVAFTVSSLTVLYIKTIFKFVLKITRLKDIQSHKLYLFKHIIPGYSKKTMAFPEGGHHQRHPPSHRHHHHHHQGFAYIALMHSLPWALAAGTALLIAFSFYPSNHNSEVPESAINATTQILVDSVKSSVNILFDGLDSLFTCSVRSPRESIQYNTMYPPVSQSKVVKIPYVWIPSFLLIILPLILQTLIILSFIMLVFISRYKRSTVNMRSCSNNNNNNDDDQLPGDPLDFTDDREMKVIENKDTLRLQNKSMASPIRLFSCFPVNPYSFSHNRTTNTIENIQPLVMPCLPASGFIVPAMSSVSNSTPFNDSKQHNEMNSSGFLLPVSGNNIDASSNMIANTLHNLYSGGHDISIGHHNSTPLRDTQLIGNFASLSDTSLTPEIDFNQTHLPTCRNMMKDAFPQLCQHHQRLLEQQYEQPSATSTVKRNRNFGSVPRFKQTTVTDFNALLIGKPTPDTSHRRDSPSPSPSPVDNSKPETVNEIFAFQQMRQTTGQSTATAAVMAAAAAAVAAQAGTLSRAVNPTVSSLVTVTSIATATTATDPLSLTNGTPPSPLFVNAQKQAEQMLLTENCRSDVNTVTH
ncbi:unnamed protein product [Trichobilharzia regenti]|nr:unnamed protein product [Trichobilharzia regenti]